MKDYDMLMSKLGELSKKLVVEKIPKFVLNCIKIPILNNIIDFDKLDPVLSSSLLPFQVEGLKYVLFNVIWFSKFTNTFLS